MDDQDRDALPKLVALLQNCERSLAEQGASVSLAQKHDELQDLLDSGEIHRLIRNELTQLARNGGRTPPASTGTVFVLAETENYVLTLSLLKASASASERLYSLPNDALVANLSPQPFHGYLHRIPDGCINDIFDPSMALIRGEAFDLRQYEVCFWNSSATVPEYTARQDVAMLKLNSKRTQSLLWCYDKQTLQPLLSAACTPLPSRLQMSAVCLAELQEEFDERQRAAAVENLGALAAHEFHYVRWSALQNLYQIDEATTVPLLESSAQRDRHPHVRRAAERSLRALAHTP